MSARNVSVLLLIAFTSAASSCRVQTAFQNHRDSLTCSAYQEKVARYLTYDVNESEGFNLRCDVFIRMARMIQHLNQKCVQQLVHGWVVHFDQNWPVSRDQDHRWILLLPPWYRMRHWAKGRPIKHSWARYFDLDDLNKTTPMLDLYDLAQGASEIHLTQPT